MSRISRLTVLTVAAVFTLAGCSSAIPADTDTDAGASAEASTEASASTEETESAEPDADAAAGEVFTGQGYSFSVPEGWGDPGQDLLGTGIDTYAADLVDIEDGFADNINVLLSPAGHIPNAGLEAAAIAELETAGATNVSAGEPADVDGAEAIHVSATFEQDGVTYLIDQFYPSTDTQTYVVTFSFSPEATDARRSEVIDSILASWTWS